MAYVQAYGGTLTFPNGSIKVTYIETGPRVQFEDTTGADDGEGGEMSAGGRRWPFRGHGILNGTDVLGTISGNMQVDLKTGGKRGSPSAVIFDVTAQIPYGTQNNVRCAFRGYWVTEPPYVAPS
jgi:hypothetical protein